MGAPVSYSYWKRKSINSPAVILLGLSVLSLGLYLVLVMQYPLGPSLVDPRATWVTLNGGNLNWLVIHLVVYLLLTLLYWVSLKILTSRNPEENILHPERTNKKRWIYGVIITSWLIFSAVMMTSASAGESHDIFDYIFRGRMMVEFNANPLSEIPMAYRTNAFIRFVAWQKNVDTYGPLWEMASFGVSSAVHRLVDILGWDIKGLPSCPESPASCRLLITYLTGYRLLAVILSGISAALIGSMVTRTQPGLVPAALVAWLWNPLAVMSTAVGGHNDLLMIVMLLIGLWLMQRQLPFLALVALILAAHVKIVALIWIPLFGLWILYKWGWKRALYTITGSTFVGLIISWLLYLPFGGWGSLPSMLQERTQYLANSAWQIAYSWLYKELGWPKEDVMRLTTDLPTWLFITIAILLSLWFLNFRPKRWQRTDDPLDKDDRRLWISLAWISLIYLIVGAFWFQHWYILWVLAPAALLPGSNFTRNILPYLSLGALSSNLAQGFMLAYLPEGKPRTGIYSLTYAMIWLPALIAGLCLFIVHRIRTRENAV